MKALHIEFEQPFRRGDADDLGIEIDVRDKFGHGGKQDFLAFRREDGPEFLLSVEKDVKARAYRADTPRPHQVRATRIRE